MLRFLPLQCLLALSGGYFAQRHPGWGAALLLAAGGLVPCVFIARRPRIAAAVGILLIAAAGWSSRPSPPPIPAAADELRRFRGHLVDDPTRRESGFAMIVQLEATAAAAPGPWRSTTGRVYLQVDGAPDPVPSRGDAVLFRARLRPLTGFRNPGSGAFAAHLARRAVSARATASWPQAALFALPDANTSPWSRWRRNASRAIAEAARGPAAGVLQAMTLGDRSGLPPEVRRAFRRSGTSHLLAISGLHLGILALLLTPILRRTLAWIPRLALHHPVEPLAWALALPALAGYAALSGCQTSTLRALCMVGLLILGKALSRPAPPLVLLSSTALALALGRPGVLEEPGFHLSLAALAGLFWLAPQLERRLAPRPDPVDTLLRPSPRTRRVRTTLARVRSLACASFAASLTTTPVVLFHFGDASAVGFFLNLLAVPLLGFIALPASLVALAIQPLAPLGSDLLWGAAGSVVQVLLKAQDVLPSGSLDRATFAFATPFGLIGAALLLACLHRVLAGKATVRVSVALLGFGTVCLLTPPTVSWARARLDPGMHLWVLDVGQGQSVAVRFRSDRWVLIDAGGFIGSAFDLGREVVIPALETLGCRKLWLAVSSHPHPDHTLGMPSVVAWGRPETLWLPATFHGDPRYGALLDAADTAGAQVLWVDQEASAAATADARLLARCARGSSENDRSLVLRAQGPQWSVLVPGDVEARGQEFLLASGFPLASDLLVAPHHGSATALFPPFLGAVDARAVLISAAGRRNLPATDFLRAAAQSGTETVSTHQAGALHARWRAGALHLETQGGPSWAGLHSTPE